MNDKKNLLNNSLAGISEVCHIALAWLGNGWTNHRRIITQMQIGMQVKTAGSRFKLHLGGLILPANEWAPINLEGQRSSDTIRSEIHRIVVPPVKALKRA